MHFVIHPLLLFDQIDTTRALCRGAFSGQYVLFTFSLEATSAEADITAPTAVGLNTDTGKSFPT